MGLSPSVFLDQYNSSKKVKWSQYNAILGHTVNSAGVGVDIADIASIGDKVKMER